MSMTDESNNFRALVVDDNPHFQEIFRTALEFAGYEVSIVSNGQEAIEALEKHRFYALFLDLNMPVMDGGAVLRKIAGKYPAMYIIVLTANSERSTDEVEQMSDFQ